MKKTLLILLVVPILFLGKAYAQLELKTIHPKIISKTKFVAFKEYSKVDTEVYDSLIKISNDDILSYVDLNGNYIYGAESKLRYGGAGYNHTRGIFSEGAAMVSRDKKQNTILYTNKKYLDLPDTYSKVSGFCDGIAMAEKATGYKKACCYINNKGEEVLPALSIVFSYFMDPFTVAPLSEGMRAFLDPETKTWGYADSEGKIIIKPQFTETLPFSEGLAAVAIKENYSNKWGFIDKEGKMVIPATYQYYPSSFSEGLAVVRISYNNMAYIDKTGKVVSQEYYECNNFKDGYAFVNIGFCKTQVIDRNFNVVKVFDDKDAFEIPRNDVNNIFGLTFYEGLAAIKPFNSGGMIINSKGDIIYRGKDQDIIFNNFYDGNHAIITFNIGNLWCTGVMNKAGEIILAFFPEGTTLTPKGVPATGDRVVETDLVSQIISPVIEIPTLPTAGIGYIPRRKKGGSAPVANKYNLTLAVNPSEAGSVTGDGTYVEGEQVNIRTTDTYSNKYKYYFSNWQHVDGKEISTLNIYTFRMPSNDLQITAVYKENKKFKLTLESSNHEYGNISGGGEYYKNEPFNISASAKEGYKFAGWYKNNALYSKSIDISKKPMPEQDLHLVAKFVENKEEVWYPSVLLTSNHPDAVLSGGGKYKEGEEFTISSTIPDGYEFVGWYVGSIGPIKPITLTRKMYNLSRSYTAIFKRKNGGTEDLIPYVLEPKNWNEIIFVGPPPYEPIIDKPLPENLPLPTNNREKPNVYSFVGDYEITLSSQSVAHFANNAAPIKIPGTMYMELHTNYDMQTMYTGDVLGVLYFDFEPIPVPNDLLNNKKYMEYNSGFCDSIISIYFTPFYIYRITDKYIYTMGEGFAGADRKETRFNRLGAIYRFEYKIVDRAIVLGKYEIYDNTIIRVNADGSLKKPSDPGVGIPKNKYEWINPGYEANPDDTYKSELDKENRYNGCKLYYTKDRMVIPWIARPEMLKLFDKSLTKSEYWEDMKKSGVNTWTDFILMLYNNQYEPLYNDLRRYNQPNIITNVPLPTF